MEFAIADRISFLNPADWDAVTARAGLFLSREYLSVVQRAGPNDLSHRYGLVYRAAEPVAAVAVQCVRISGTQLVQSAAQLSDDDRKQLALKKLGRKALKRLRRRVMVCGNLLAWGPHGAAFAPDEDPVELWPAVAEILYRIRRANRLHGRTDYVLVKDLSEQLSDQAAPLGRFSYRRLETEPDMVLDIPPDWESFDDYLANLTKKYRKSARNAVKAFDNDEAGVERIVSVRNHQTRLHELYHNVASRAEVRLAEAPPGFLPELAETFGPDRFAAIGIHRSGELIGFVTVLRDSETAVGYYIGLDYDANERMPVYHRLLYAVIEQAINWRCRRISFGRTALDAKARLGCHPVATSVWVRHRVPLLNLVVRQLLKTVSHAEPPDRSPFKAPPADDQASE